MRGRLAILAGVAAVAACQSGDWGPLAVTDEDASAVLQARGGAGPLRIGPTCVTLVVEEVDPDREITLVWRDSQVSWLPMTLEIIFEDFRAGQLHLSNGDRIEVGGAGISDPDDPDQGAPQPRWIAPPDPSCPDELFAVHSVRRLDQ